MHKVQERNLTDKHDDGRDDYWEKETENGRNGYLIKKTLYLLKIPSFDDSGFILRQNHRHKLLGSLFLPNTGNFIEIILEMLRSVDKVKRKIKVQQFIFIFQVGFTELLNPF